MSLNLTDFANFFKKQFKSGSLILAVFIPLLLLLSQFKFVRQDFMVAINQVLIIIALVEVTFRLGLHFFLNARIQVAEINKDIKEGNLDLAKAKVQERAVEAVVVAKETAKELIDYAKKPKETENITKIETEVPGHQTSER